MEELTFCAVHPDRETGLRCNQCDRYMCVECAVYTPVGYRCKQCVRQVDDKFFNAEALDHWKVLGVALLVGIVSGGILGYFRGLGFFLAIIASFPVGALAGQWALQSIQRRRGRNHWQYGVLGLILGVLVGLFVVSFLTYPDSMRLMYDAFQTMTPEQRQLTRGMRVGILSQSDYAVQQMLALPNLIFVVVSAYSLYIRMKP
jgi:uncharacterized membrane protein YeaQ/YmgE (transglycosylase-associated protein family)